MALVEANLQKDIEKAIYESADMIFTGHSDPKIKKFAKLLAKAINDHILTITVHTDVTTQVTTTAPPGVGVQVVPITGTGATITPVASTGTGVGVNQIGYVD